MTDQNITLDEWAIVELLGHRRLAGRVREVTLAGAGMLRLDIPATPGHGPETQYIGPSSVYALHPTTEAIATAAAARCRPEPVSRWELEHPPALPVAAEATPARDPWAPVHRDEVDDPEDDELDDDEDQAPTDVEGPAAESPPVCGVPYGQPCAGDERATCPGHMPF